MPKNFQTRPGEAAKPPGRRTPPPEATGAEVCFLNEIKERRALVVVELSDGLRMSGRVEYFDRNMIKLTRPGGANVFLKKSDVRLIQESPGGADGE